MHRWRAIQLEIKHRRVAIFATDIPCIQTVKILLVFVLNISQSTAFQLAVNSAFQLSRISYRATDVKLMQ